MRKFILMLIVASALIANELTITSEDGFKLHGWLDKPAASKEATPVVLFAHQFGADHTTWSDLAKKLNAKGYATLNVDLRGHGKSILQNNKENRVIIEDRVDHIREALLKSDESVKFKKIPADLIAWIELLSEDESLDVENLYLFGSSLGAGSLIPLLSEYDAKALVTISAGKPKDLLEDIDMALAASMTKMLFIASKNDPLGAANTALEYGKKSILGASLIISDDSHGTAMLPKVEHFILSFIDSIE